MCYRELLAHFLCKSALLLRECILRNQSTKTQVSCAHFQKSFDGTVVDKFVYYLEYLFNSYLYHCVFCFSEYHEYYGSAYSEAEEWN
jgi:hypothetical protein